MLSEQVIVGSDGGFKNVVVYVSKGFNRFSFTPPKAAALLDQDGCKYIPHVLTLMAGQPLQVRNSDPLNHNYHFIGRYNDEINRTQAKPMTHDVDSLTEPELGGNSVATSTVG